MEYEADNQSGGEDLNTAALVDQLWKKVKHARRDKQHWYKSIERHRAFVKGFKNTNGSSLVTDSSGMTDDVEKEKVKANIIYATLASALPHIYAKNPEIVVNPTEAVDPGQYQLIKGFCRTLQIVLNKYLEKAFLKKRAKGAVRSTQTAGLAWAKVSYQRDLEQDQKIMGRIQDLQDNVERIRYLSKTSDGESQQDAEAKKAELEQQIKALQANVDVVVREGLVIDLLLAEDVTIDPAVKNFDDYRNSEWISHRVWYGKEKYEQTFKKCPEGSAARYIQGEKNENATDDDLRTQYRVEEFWHRVSNTVYTFTEGAKEWSREPYQPSQLGEHWYPFFPLGFNLIDGQFEPMSDVELLKNLQDEYHNLRQQQETHRDLSKPFYLADSDVSEQVIQRRTVAGIGEIIILDANGRPLKEVFQAETPPPYNPLIYDVTPIRSDIELVSGMGDAARGNITKAKTLGEAEILQDALTSRSDERKDDVEDWIQDMAQYSAEIFLQVLTPEQVQRIAGPPAQMGQDGKLQEGSVWPSMAKEQVFDMVKVEIRAGTSGKPNKAREQEVWTKFLPQMQELLRGVAEARAAGNVEIAQSFIKLAQETYRRFDERIDVEEFLPQVGEDQQQLMQQQQAMMQQMQAMQLELQKLQAEVRKTNAEAVKTEIEAKIAATQPVMPATQNQYMQ